MQNNQKKKKKTYTSCAGAWADAGGACSNTAEGVGGRPVSDNLEKSFSKGKKKCKEKKNILYLAGNVGAGAQTNNEKLT